MLTMPFMTQGQSSFIIRKGTFDTLVNRTSKRLSQCDSGRLRSKKSFAYYWPQRRNHGDGQSAENDTTLAWLVAQADMPPTAPSIPQTPQMVLPQDNPIMFMTKDVPLTSNSLPTASRQPSRPFSTHSVC